MTEKASNEPNPRPPKKHKKEPPAELKPLQALRLQKHALHLTALVSPAAAWSNRVAAQALSDTRVRVYFASGSQVFSCDADAPGGDSAALLQGKEGVLLPSQAQAATPSVLSRPAHRSEVQSVALAHSPPDAPSNPSSWLATVDCYGQAVISRLTHTTNNQHTDTDASTSYQLAPPRPAHEAGWAGVAIASPAAGAADGPLTCATAMQFMRQVCVYQGEACVRRIGTLQCPTALAFLPGGPQQGPYAGLLACAEEHTVSFWDIRAGEQGGLVQRLQVANNGGCPLYSLAWCEGRGGMLGAAGVEKTVNLIDLRKWRIAHRWGGGTKYAVHHLAFSRAAPNWCYVTGLDNECVVAPWDGSAASGSSGNANSVSGGHGRDPNGPTGRAVGPSALFNRPQGNADGAQDTEDEQRKGAGVSFRGDAAWVGVSRALGMGQEQGGDGRDWLLAMTQAGTLFWLQTSLPAV